jgi:hypothetical protein
MPSQNPTGNDPKSVTTPPANAAHKPDKASEIKRELSDEEMAAVAGGQIVPPHKGSGGTP